MAHSRSKILQLYKNLIKESSKFEAYNYRNYALRRIRDGFKENKNVSDVDQISKLIEKAENNLNIIKRQALLSQVYSTDKLVIEKQEPHST
ncbi:LYR motif-containing protein 4 [Chrysoperla carnea]|uniref:LYR motif-containing protein 4 n=1 Tax=Chrysoperla carnea TaxID=189513 RepID=UPI001D098AD2|nr:LYR motif-containing protein 4 [Chrysoperla carnea]